MPCATTARDGALEHVQGIGNDITDVLSRGKKQVFHDLMAALGIKPRRLHVRDYPEAAAFLRDVIAVTQARECAHPDPPRFACGRCGERGEQSVESSSRPALSVAHPQRIRRAARCGS